MYPWKVPWHESMMQTIFSAICEKIGKSILENVLFLPFFSNFGFSEHNLDHVLSRNLENWLILKFVFIHGKTVKVSQDDQIRM